ncbi:hypothetical protein B0T10DRAFT_116465 [Thelonectria olida]|uniref:Uncharacterized protein n=1 Tax=Thelonectria olida TaxID=1576542 RepID=A0A9P8WIL8_9HYPO|nr:hypothetical protein B0T10DRAFT_116465 [Thelonectria olida]
MNHYVSDVDLPDLAQKKQKNPDVMDIDQPETEDQDMEYLIHQFKHTKVSTQEPPPTTPRPPTPMEITQESPTPVAVNVQANMTSNEGDLEARGRSLSAPPLSKQPVSGFPVPEFPPFPMSGPGTPRSGPSKRVANDSGSESDNGEDDDWEDIDDWETLGPSAEDMRWTLKAAYEICLQATSDFICDFRKTLEERMPAMTGMSEEPDAAEPKEEYAVMMLWRRGEPTNCLASNVSLVNSIIWQRAVAVRLLTPNAEYNAQRTMQSVTEMSRSIVKWMSPDQFHRIRLNLEYDNIYDLGGRFLKTLGEEEAQDELLRLVLGRGWLSHHWRE